jgi:hypothetical protein
MSSGRHHARLPGWARRRPPWVLRLSDATSFANSRATATQVDPGPAPSPATSCAATPSPPAQGAATVGSIRAPQCAHAVTGSVVRLVGEAAKTRTLLAAGGHRDFAKFRSGLVARSLGWRFPTSGSGVVPSLAVEEVGVVELLDFQQAFGRHLPVGDAFQVAEVLEPFDARGDNDEDVGVLSWRGGEGVRNTRRHDDQVAAPAVTTCSPDSSCAVPSSM